MSTPTEHGTQRERTRLSWRRTTLTAAVSAVLLETKLLVDGPKVAAALIGLAVTLGWFGLVLVAYRRIHALDAGVTTALRRSPALVAALVGGYALLGLAAALVL